MAAAENQNGPLATSPGWPDGAFEDVISEHQRMIQSLCYRMTGSLADADDLAQETFIQAYLHRESFRGDSKLSSWLYRIAMNQCLNWKSRAARLDRLHRDWGEQEALEGIPVSRAPSAELVQAALMKLPAKQRAAVVLTTYDGFSHAEAAATLGCSETTVSWRLFAARRKLKTLLQNARSASAL